MTTSAFVAAALALALALGSPLATPPRDGASVPDVVVVNELGVHGIPARWFDDATVVPGDSAERTILIENGRADETTITVALTDVEPPSDSSLLSDLRLYWDTSSATIGDLATTGPVLADQVAIAPGEQLPLTLGYEYPASATRIPNGMQTLTFTISLTAEDPRAGGETSGGSESGAGAGSGAGSGAASGGALATTGGEFAPWWVWGVLGGLGGLWLLLARRRRKDDAYEEHALAVASVRPEPAARSPH